MLIDATTRGIFYAMRHLTFWMNETFTRSQCLAFALLIDVWYGSVGIKLHAVAAEVCKNLGSPVFSLEREQR